MTQPDIISIDPEWSDEQGVSYTPFYSPGFVADSGQTYAADVQHMDNLDQADSYWWRVTCSPPVVPIGDGLEPDETTPFVVLAGNSRTLAEAKAWAEPALRFILNGAEHGSQLSHMLIVSNY